MLMSAHAASILANRGCQPASPTASPAPRIDGPKMPAKAHVWSVEQFLTYGGNEGCVEGVVREAEQNTGLPHARITDEE